MIKTINLELSKRLVPCFYY